MKTSFTIAKVASGLALLAVSSAAMASVVNTPHNLGMSNQSGGNYTTATTEICVFCHTPHGGNQQVDAPIWNRSLSTATEGQYKRFSAMGRQTFDAAEAPIGNVSAACLSCHDGTQAMDAVINGPGSGNNGNSVNTIAGGDWTETGVHGSGLGTNGAMNNLSNGASDNGITSGDLIWLGTDLRNDHPISMQYGGGGIKTGSAATVKALTNDPDFAQAEGSTGNSATRGYPGGLCDAAAADPTCTVIATGNGPSNARPVNASGTGNTTGAVNGSGTGLVKHSTDTAGNDKWWVDTNGGATFTSEDFPLYTRTFTSVNTSTSAGVAEPTVECGTCHDPHSANSTFLRLVGGNRGSQVCLTCHAK